ncbi:hypothetical protein [Shewanella gaetbuli]|uniref:Uncharacterized protein n=1 Tax=Shewanella gaetbuli TaxID=220752 RepID=A0A9X2CKC3_9GAMM|nr:hypothetical protein [Shewanella gaetbuli]MCL1142966.1 hypothetical protein [Shewanella gaetbuli]
MTSMTRSALLAQLTSHFEDLPLFSAECALSPNIDKRVLGEMINNRTFTIKELTSQLALVLGVNVIEDCPNATGEMTQERARLVSNFYTYCGFDQLPRNVG